MHAKASEVKDIEARLLGCQNEKTDELSIVVPK
jgi:hypothetical protein